MGSQNINQCRSYKPCGRSSKDPDTFAPPSVNNSQLSGGAFFQLGVDQKIALCASLAARNFAVLISAFVVHSISFFPCHLPTNIGMCLEQVIRRLPVISLICFTLITMERIRIESCR